MALTSPGAAAADEDSAPRLPAPRWLTLETPHFRVHFYEELRELAERTAFVAEHAHPLLTRYFNWLPKGRVDITLNDQTDGANGFASSIPYNYIFGYAIPPAPMDELNDFDDFVKLLFVHELTHVVHLDTIMGPARLLNFLLGKRIAPNLAQPSWFVEGAAVLMETRNTSAGRLRSSYFDMLLRVPLLEGRMHDLAATSHLPLAYPQGTTAYLYGSSFVKYIEDRFGPEKIAELSHRYGQRLIPGAINRTSREALGLRYDELWRDWKAALGRRYALQVEEASRRGLTQTRRLTFDGQGPGGDGMAPRYLPDGSGVVYQRVSNVDRPAFMLVDPATGQSRPLKAAFGAAAASPTPDGRGLVYHQVNQQPLRRRISGSSHVDWMDIYRLDLDSGEVSQLTSGRRAHSPDVSPDGRLVACTFGRPGAFDLAIVPTDGGPPRVVATAPREIAYTPSWSPDGRQIAYSRWKPGGYRDIHVYDLETGKDRALWIDRAIDADPRYTRDGRYIVFSSDRSGIYNIYAYELATEQLYQVTNVLGGAFQPTVSPDGRQLVFTGFTSDGQDLFEAAFQPESWQLAEPYVTTREDAPPVPTPPASAAAAAKDPIATAVAQATVKPYQPWRYMYPRTWNLAIPTDPLGLGTSLRVQTGVGDAVGIHRVDGDAMIPLDGDAALRADYSYLGLWPSFGATVSRAAYLARDLVVDGQRQSYRQHAVSASAQVGLPILRRPDAAADMHFGYRYFDYRPADALPVADPTSGIVVPPATGPDAGFFLGWAYANARAWGHSISAQEGRRVSLNVSASDRALGGRYRTTDLSWSWTEYLTPPWAKLHAFALGYNGGISVGDRHGAFGIGGFAEQDLLRSIFLNRRQCCLFLRGYPAGSVVGSQYHIASAEYRLPLLWIEKGYETFPLYLRRLHGAVFGDAGNAFDGPFRLRDLRYGVGAEVRLEFSLAYYLASELQLGVAKGLSTGGATDWYLVSAFHF